MVVYLWFFPIFDSVRSLSCVPLFVTPWTAACQASLSITNTWSLLKLMSVELVMLSNHLILCPPSPLSFNLSQPQGLFQWVSSSHQVAKVLELQLQHQSFQWIFRTDFHEDCLVSSPGSPRDSQESSSTPQFRRVISSVLSFLFTRCQLYPLPQRWQPNVPWDIAKCPYAGTKSPLFVNRWLR